MPLEGLQLGHYRLLQLIGQGGMSDVYLAEDLRIPRQVAIKVIRVEGTSYPNHQEAQETARLFQREARAVAKLDHPNILPLFEYGEEVVNGITLTYLVMPYCPEGSLLTLLNRRTDSEPLPLQDVDHIIRQAAEALQYAHDQQIIHRDVKPSNFLIRGRSGGARIPNLLLADFGLAKLTNLSATMSQSIRGTPTYMAPEQWSGSPVPATDQYALAVMAYELLTGRPPFEGTQQQMMFHHLMTQPQPPSRYNPRFSPDMDAVLLRALAKKPEDRFPSVSAFADAFSQALKGQQQPAADPRPIAQKPLAQPPSPVSSPGMPTTLPPVSPVPELISMPSRPTPGSTSPPPGARRSYRVNASLLITFASVLLLLTGSIGVFFVVRNNQIATDHANATSTASSQTATANNATATAIAQANATATALASPLPAPVQVSPSNRTVFHNYPRTTTLTWEAVSGAASYSVQIYYYLGDTTCTGGTPYPVVTGITGTSYTFDFIGAQPGCWQVQAVNASGRAGVPSPLWEFSYTQ